MKEESLRKALDPTEFVKGRTLYGGPAPEESRRRIEELTMVLKRNKQAVADIRGRLKEASAALESAVDNIINAHMKTVDSE